SHKINEQDRADQASSTKWDTTFTICEGEVTKQKLYWLQSELPKQKLGRGDSSCLVWSRANKSQRIFEYIVEELSKGYQPDIDFIAEVGYILRTTAVFGNGKCGINPLENIKENHAFSGALHAELFSVYMIRQFSFDLVEHIAKRRNTEAASLSPNLKKYIGIGNSTGLGMVFFLTKHPKLLHRWMKIRETALAKVKELEVSKNKYKEALNLLENYKEYFLEDSNKNTEEIFIPSNQVAKECNDIKKELLKFYNTKKSNITTWSKIINKIKTIVSLETQELFNSLVIELYPDLISSLETLTISDENYSIQPEMHLSKLKKIIKSQYFWAFKYNFDLKEENYYLWYRTIDRNLPYLGVRGKDEGKGQEHPFDIAKKIQLLL